MEGYPDRESQEAHIRKLIAALEREEGMETDTILLDLITFASYEGNGSANPDYIEEVAEKLGIPVESLNAFAARKAREYGTE